MTHIETHHEIERGEQITTRTVTVTDAAGNEYEHEFEYHPVADTDGTDSVDAHEYRGDGDPPDSALEALKDYLGGEEGDTDE